jgi:hypothetical protein
LRDVPNGDSLRRVNTENLLTEAMLGNASPRKPSDFTENKSSAKRILLVA